MALELTAEDIAYRNFVLVQASWPVTRAWEVAKDLTHDLAEELRPTHVIVQRRDGENRFYLYMLEEFLQRLNARPGASDVSAALDLHEYQATPLVEAASAATMDMPSQCVVHVEGRPTGFIDDRVPPPPTPRRGGESERRRGGGTLSPPTNATLSERALAAELPQELVLGKSTSLLVYLSETRVADAALPLPDLPQGSNIHIVVVARRGVVVNGDNEGTLTVSGTDRTLSLRFEIRATEVGTAQVEVLAFHGVQPLGLVKLTPTVVENASMGGERSLREQPVAPISIRQPDLSLLILERIEGGGKRILELRLTAADPSARLSYRPFGPISLEVDPASYFEGFFDGIENLALGTAEQREVAKVKLEAKGAYLFKMLLPSDLQSTLWTLRERVQSIQIHSVEPWIPWELCKLCGEENGRVVEGPFLAEAFAVTRWIMGTPEKPTLRLKNVAVVVPEDSKLPFAATELEYLLSLAGSGRQVNRVPATFLDVRRELIAGTYDGWHFTGHGSFGRDDPNRSAIYLRGNDPFTPEDLSGVVSNLGLADPLVFLNACEVGRASLSLTGVGGWGAQFLRAGAAAFIGTYWSVYDTPALQFAHEIYDRLLGLEGKPPLPIGQAVREARSAIKAARPGDPTWLAYTVFANPLASVTIS